MNTRQKDPSMLVNQRGGRGRGLTVRARDGSLVVPPAPRGLRAYGKRAWNEFWQSDVSAVVQLAADREEIDHWARCVDERAKLWEIVKKSRLIKGSHGQLMTNPLVRQIRELTADINRVSDRFGMNPTSRFRLQFSATAVVHSANDLLDMLDDDDDTEADEGDEFPVPDGTVIRLARERRS
jgi:P27 family predicted phage terminase small subunit